MSQSGMRQEWEYEVGGDIGDRNGHKAIIMVPVRPELCQVLEFLVSAPRIAA